MKFRSHQDRHRWRMPVHVHYLPSIVTVRHIDQCCHKCALLYVSTLTDCQETAGYMWSKLSTCHRPKARHWIPACIQGPASIVSHKPPYSLHNNGCSAGLDARACAEMLRAPRPARAAYGTPLDLGGNRISTRSPTPRRVNSACTCLFATLQTTLAAHTPEVRLSFNSREGQGIRAQNGTSTVRRSGTALGHSFVTGRSVGVCPETHYLS